MKTEKRLKIERSGKYLLSLLLTSSLFLFWRKEFWIITLIILLIVYVLWKSKHLILVVFMIMLTRSSQRISNPMRCAYIMSIHAWFSTYLHINWQAVYKACYFNHMYSSYKVFFLTLYDLQLTAFGNQTLTSPGDNSKIFVI